MRFQVEEGMDAANLVENVIILSVDDVGTQDLELGGERQDDLHIEAEVNGDVDEEGKTERLDYGSSRDKEDEPTAATQTEAHQRTWIQSMMQVVEYDDNGSDRVIFVSCFML